MSVSLNATALRGGVLTRAGGSLLALVVSLAAGSGSAYAQTSASNSQSAQENSSPSDNQDIVVTAQFRKQNLQETPLAISAFSGEAIEQKNVTDILGATALAPNVSVARGASGFGQFAGVFIRGVGQADIHFAVEPGVGIYVDDVYYGVMSGSVFQLLDTDRVEVLRGPQGTLAGKNSIGGSMKLFSVKPGPDPKGYAELTYGSRNLLSGRAASNFTIVDDKLYARISVAGRRRDGYMDRLDYACATGAAGASRRLFADDCKIGTQGGESVWSARASLRWLVNDKIENTLIFDAVEDSSENPASKQIVSSPTWTGGANYQTGPTSYTNYENYITRPSVSATSTTPASPAFSAPSTTPLHGNGITNLLDIDLNDSLKLQSITGYRTSRVTLSAQLEASPATVNDQIWRLSHKQFTQELRLSGKVGSILDWTVGGYYYHATGTSEGRINIDGGLVSGGGGVDLEIFFKDPVKTESKSIFLHTVWHPTEKMNITLAGRYTNDRKDFTFNRYDINGNPHPLLGALVGLTRSFKGNRFDYRIGADYQITDDILAFAQVSTGFKGGGVNPRPFFVSQALPFAPETLTAFEVGFKSQFFDRAVTLNGSLFLNKFNNIQGTLLRCDDISPFPGAPCTATRNIGDADVKGAELEYAIRPISGLSLEGSLGYLDFQYKTVNAATLVTVGMKPAYVPKFNAVAGLQYEASLGAMGSLTPRLDYTYRSSIFTDAVNTTIGNRLPSLSVFNAKLTWRNEANDWSASLAVTNVFDKFYFESTQLRPDAPYFSGTGRPGQPRNWSLTVKRTF